MFDTPIKTIKQAMEYFKYMGCSHFHMAREYPQRYEEYKQFNISSQKETEWKVEQFYDLCKNIMENKNNNQIWIIYNNIAELCESIRADEELKKTLEVTQYIRDRVAMEDRIIISETINGRKYRRFRSGLIYLSYDLNNNSIAKNFVELSLHFATYIKHKSRDFERCQNATKLCNEIKAELQL